MDAYSVYVKAKREAPLSASEVKKEIERLSDASRLVKGEVAAHELFPVIESHFRALIDADAVLPRFSTTYLYLCEEGFLTVFTVLYTLLRAACRTVRADVRAENDCAFLTFEGGLSREEESACAALAITEKMLHALCSIAKAAGFDVTPVLSKDILTLRFSFVRFRAIPVSGYSCSEEFVRDKMNRALRLFMQEDAFFDIEG